MEEKIWFVLSDLLVDNEIDFDLIASKIYTFTLDDIKYKLFYEVAPLYGNEYFTPSAYEWLGYEKKLFISTVKKSIERKEKNLFYRIIFNLKGHFYRVTLNFVWVDLKKSILKFRVENNTY